MTATEILSLSSAEILDKLRERYTLGEVSRAAGVSKPNLSKIANGSKPNPGEKTYRALAALLIGN